MGLVNILYQTHFIASGNIYLSRNFSFFLCCFPSCGCATLNVEIGRKEGDHMKKVMLLAPENLCDILRDALETKYIALPCSDPSTAKEILLSEPDTLILSLFLPGMDSLTFLREKAAILPPKVIALTVYFDDAILFELEDLGVSQVIRIPCNLRY